MVLKAISAFSLSYVVQFSRGQLIEVGGDEKCS